MLLEYIERARNQPKEVKQRLVWTWSFMLTGIIVLVWISVLIGREYAENGGRTAEEVRVAAPEPQDTASRFNAANEFLKTEPAAFIPSREIGTSTVPDTATGTEETGSSSAPLWP
jgi:hypothetical protein